VSSTVGRDFVVLFPTFDAALPKVSQKVATFFKARENLHSPLEHNNNHNEVCIACACERESAAV
jgi:hypothetical protein